MEQSQHISMCSREADKQRLLYIGAGGMLDEINMSCNDYIRRYLGLSESVNVVEVSIETEPIELGEAIATLEIEDKKSKSDSEKTLDESQGETEEEGTEDENVVVVDEGSLDRRLFDVIRGDGGVLSSAIFATELVSSSVTRESEEFNLDENVRQLIRNVIDHDDMMLVASYVLLLHQREEAHKLLAVLGTMSHKSLCKSKKMRSTTISFLLLQELVSMDQLSNESRNHVLRILAAMLFSIGASSSKASSLGLKGPYVEKLYTSIWTNAHDDPLTERLAIQCSVFGLELFFPTDEARTDHILKLFDTPKSRLYLECFLYKVTEEEIALDTPDVILLKYIDLAHENVQSELQANDLYINEETFGIALSNHPVLNHRERVLFYLQGLCIFKWHSVKNDKKSQALFFEEARCAETISILSNNVIEQKSDKEWGTALANIQMGYNTGVYRWSVKISKCDKGHVFLGIATQEANSSTYLGGDRFGWGLIGTKVLWHNRSKMGSYRLGFRTGETVQVTFDSKDGVLSYSTRDRDWGPAFRIENSNLILQPAVALYQKGDSVELMSSNFEKKKKKRKKHYERMQDLYDRVSASAYFTPFLMKNWSTIIREPSAMLTPLLAILCLWPEQAFNMDIVLDLTRKLLELLQQQKHHRTEHCDISGDWAISCNQFEGSVTLQVKDQEISATSLNVSGRYVFDDQVQINANLHVPVRITARIMPGGDMIVGQFRADGNKSGTIVLSSKKARTSTRDFSIVELIGILCGKLAAILTRGLELTTETEADDELEDTKSEGGQDIDSEFMDLLRGGFSESSIAMFLQKQIQQHQDSLFSIVNTDSTKQGESTSEEIIKIVESIDVSMLRVAPSELVKLGGPPMRVARHLVVAAMLLHSGVFQEARLIVNDPDAKPSRLLIAIWRAAQRIIEWAIKEKQTNGTTYVLLAEKLSQRARFLLRVTPSNEVCLDYESDFLVHEPITETNVFSNTVADSMPSVEHWKRAAHAATMKCTTKHAEIVETLVRFIKSDIALVKIEATLMEGAWKALQRTAGLNLFAMLLKDKPIEFKVGVLPSIAPAIRGCISDSESPTHTPTTDRSVPELSPFDFVELGLVRTVESTSIQKETFLHYTSHTKGCGRELKQKLKTSFQKLYSLLKGDLQLAISSDTAEWQYAIVSAWDVTLSEIDHDFIANVGIFETFHRLLENARSANQVVIIKSTLNVVRSLASQVVLSVSSVQSTLSAGSSRSLNRTFSAPSLGKSVFELLFDELDVALEVRDQNTEEEEEYCYQVVLLLYTVSIEDCSMFIKQIRIESLFLAAKHGSPRIQHRTVRLLGRILPQVTPHLEHVHALIDLVSTAFPSANKMPSDKSDVVSLLRRLATEPAWTKICQEEFERSLDAIETCPEQAWAVLCVYGGNIEHLRVCGKVRLSPFLLSRVDDGQFDDIRMLIRKPAVLASLTANQAKVLLPDESDEPSTLISASMDSKILIPLPEAESVPDSFLTASSFSKIVDRLFSQDDMSIRIASLKCLSSSKPSDPKVLNFLKQLALRDVNASLQDLSLIELWWQAVMKRSAHKSVETSAIAEESTPSASSNPNLQSMLALGFGFSPEVCQLALHRCGNDVHAAVEYCLEHAMDMDLLVQASTSSVILTKLVEMGFPEKWCKKAIEVTGDNFDEALTWILSNDELLGMEDNETTSTLAPADQETASPLLTTTSGMDAVDIHGLKVGVKPAISGFPSFGAKDLLLVQGCWYYEVRLHSDNCMQIGWADASFTGDAAKGDGVGDDTRSWAFDGYRELFWNGRSRKWGKKWREGDVVCVAIDLDKGDMWFGLNGEYFQGNPIVTGLCRDIDYIHGLYPSASLNRTEKLEFIFENFNYKAPFACRPLIEAWGDATANARFSSSSVHPLFKGITSDCLEEEILSHRSKDRYFSTSWTLSADQDEVDDKTLSVSLAVKAPTKAHAMLSTAKDEEVTAALTEATEVLETMYSRIALFHVLDHGRSEWDFGGNVDDLILYIRLLSFDLQSKNDIAGLLDRSFLDIDEADTGDMNPLMARFECYLNYIASKLGESQFLNQIFKELARAGMRIFADLEWMDGHRTTSNVLSRAKRHDFLNQVGEKSHINAQIPSVRFACWLTNFLINRGTSSKTEIGQAWVLSLRSPGVSLKSIAARKLCEMISIGVVEKSMVPRERLERIVLRLVHRQGVGSPIQTYYGQVLMELVALISDAVTDSKAHCWSHMYSGTFEQHAIYVQEPTKPQIEVQVGDTVISKAQPHGLGIVIDTVSDDCEDSDGGDHFVVEWSPNKDMVTLPNHDVVSVVVTENQIRLRRPSAPKLLKSLNKAEPGNLKFGQRFRLGFLLRVGYLNESTVYGEIEFPELSAVVELKGFKSNNIISLTETRLVRGSPKSGWMCRFGVEYYVPGTTYEFEILSSKEKLHGSFICRNSPLLVGSSLNDLEKRKSHNDQMLLQETSERNNVPDQAESPQPRESADLLEALLRPLMGSAMPQVRAFPKLKEQRERVAMFQSKKITCTIVLDETTFQVEVDNTYSVMQALKCIPAEIPACFKFKVDANEYDEMNILISELGEENIHIEIIPLEETATESDGDSMNMDTETEEQVIISGSVHCSAESLFCFNPDARGSTMALSDNDRTVTLSANEGDCRGVAMGNVGFSSGIYYWEVKISMEGAQDYGSVFVGVCERYDGLFPAGTQMSYLRRWDRTPSAYGFVNFRATLESQAHGQSMEHIYGEFYGDGDTIGVCVNMDESILTFFLDGMKFGQHTLKNLGTAFASLPKTDSEAHPFTLYPMIGLRRVRGCSVSVSSKWICIPQYPAKQLVLDSTLVYESLISRVRFQTFPEIFIRRAYEEMMIWADSTLYRYPSRATGQYVEVDTCPKKCEAVSEDVKLEGRVGLRAGDRVRILTRDGRDLEAPEQAVVLGCHRGKIWYRLESVAAGGHEGMEEGASLVWYWEKYELPLLEIIKMADATEPTQLQTNISYEDFKAHVTGVGDYDRLVGIVNRTSSDLATDPINLKIRNFCDISMAEICQISMLRLLNVLLTRLLPTVSFEIMGGALSDCDFQPDTETKVESWSCGALIMRLRHLVFTWTKKEFWERVLDRTTTPTTLATDEYEDPPQIRTVNVNRIRAAPTKLASIHDAKSRFDASLFGQLFAEISSSKWSDSSLRRAYIGKGHGGQKRAFKVKFLGEGVKDYGGPYRAVFEGVAEELQNDQESVNSRMACLLPLFLPCPNRYNSTGDVGRDKFVFNPSMNSPQSLKYFQFLGKLCGIAIRHGLQMPLDLPTYYWHLLTKLPLKRSHLDEIDRVWVNMMNFADESTFEDRFFQVPLSDGTIVDCVPNGGKIAVTAENAAEYVRLAYQARFSESRSQLRAFRMGLASILPIELFPLFTAQELENLVCGHADMDLALLKQCTDYEGGITCDDNHVQYFWNVLESMTSSEKTAFLRFAWARSRMPQSASDMPMNFKITNPSGGAVEHPDDFLPSAQTCFFSLSLPKYSSEDIMREKLLYAINCTLMDADVRLRSAEGWADI